MTANNHPSLEGLESGGIKVLVVGNYYRVNHAISTLKNERSFKLTLTEELNGILARGLLETQWYDLVFLDMDELEGYTEEGEGFKLADIIRNKARWEGRPVCVVAYTASPYTGNRCHYWEYKHNYFHHSLRSPFCLRELENKILKPFLEELSIYEWIKSLAEI